MNRRPRFRLGLLLATLGFVRPAAAQMTAEDYFHRGFDAEQRREFNAALADFNRALALDPDYADALTGRGFVRHAKGDVAGALADFNHAIEADPRHFMAYNNRGNIKRAKGDLAGALADFDRAIKLKPDYPNALVNRGGLRAAQGDFDRAIADYDRAIALQPDHALAYNNRGNAKAAKDDFTGAIADFDRSLQFDPNNAAVCGSRGTARNASGDFIGALDDYTTAIQLAKDDAARACLYRHLTARRLHRDDIAAELVATIPKWKDAWTKTAGHYLLGDVAEAELFAEAESRHRLAEANYFAGMFHLLRDEPGDARRFFETATAIGEASDTSAGLARAELTRLSASR